MKHAVPAKWKNQLTSSNSTRTKVGTDLKLLQSKAYPHKQSQNRIIYDALLRNVVEKKHTLIFIKLLGR